MNHPPTDGAQSTRKTKEMSPPQSRHILGMRVDATSYDDASALIAQWAQAHESRYVCVATVNNVMHAFDDPEYRRVMNESDLVTPDGVPLVWGLRLLGIAGATRVYGPELMPAVCARAEAEGIPVGLYGGTEQLLAALLQKMKHRYPELEVAYHHSPPFRPLTDEEEKAVAQDIRSSGARIVFVGIGAPKQEWWMARFRGRVDAVSVGVGAAFDFLAGTKRQAPAWIQRVGLEWLYRLVSEPRRLWRRYLVGNPRFLYHFGKQLLSERPNRKKGL